MTPPGAVVPKVDEGIVLILYGVQLRMVVAVEPDVGDVVKLPDTAVVGVAASMDVVAPEGHGVT